MKKLLIPFIIIFGSFTGCSEKPEPVEQTPIIKDKPRYIELGDLTEIVTHNKIRFVSPRFDGADALPRDGIPVQNYQEMAEAFAASIGIDAEWIFVDSFEELIPQIVSGKADAIITNLTITGERQSSVSFTRPITYVDEVVISKNENPIVSFDQLENLKIAVPDGTAYVQTLEKLKEITLPNLQFTTLSSSLSDSEMLELVETGKFDATILDSDQAKVLLLEFDTLSNGLSIKKNRPIAWAVRKNSPELLAKLNEFFTSFYLTANRNSNESRDWKTIKQHGKLRMLTLNNPASYFMWRGELMGFDLDLIKEFAKQHELHVAVILKDSIGELLKALKRGEGDLIAASITHTKERESLGFVFSEPYLKINELLVGSLESEPITKINQLQGKSVGVNSESVYYDYFSNLKEKGIDLDLKTFSKITTEELTQKLSNNEFDYTGLDSHFFAIEKTHNSEVVNFLALGNTANIAWVLRPEQFEIKKHLNTFIKKEYKGLFYNLSYNKYFRHSKNISKHNEDRITEGSKLSPFDDIVKPLAERYGMDWRLLVAQMYQESKFNPKAVSFAGAKGLMQVMPRTGKEFGFENLADPEIGIHAGITYMNWIEKRFPGEIEFKERTFFNLAAYNAGVGHVRDARKLAKQLGKDPNKWFENVEYAMLQLSKPKYYKKARFGYVRGSEPVNYVKSIYERYLGYLQFTLN